MMTPRHQPKHGPEWEDVPLLDLPGEKVVRKPAKRPEKVRWTALKHRRWFCEQCVAEATRMQDPSRAEAIRDEGESSVAYCGVHAADQKVEDERSGKWRAKK